MTTIQGYCLLWRDEAVVEGGQLERFMPYALTKPIVAKLVVAHDCRTYAPIARTGARTLVVGQDDVGVRFEAQLDDDDPVVRRVISAMYHGALAHCSFIYTPINQDADGIVHRGRLTEITLSDADVLPPKFEALRECWHACRTHNRPRPLPTHRAELRPQASVAALDPLQAMMRGHMSKYLARMPR